MESQAPDFSCEQAVQIQLDMPRKSAYHVQLYWYIYLIENDYAESISEQESKIFMIEICI